MPEKGTIDAVIILGRIQEYLAKQEKLYKRFVDLEESFHEDTSRGMGNEKERNSRSFG